MDSIVGDLNGRKRKVRPRDIGRSRRARISKKHVKILLDPNQVAFAGWENVVTPWTAKTTEQFIDWCHIGKLFPHARHRTHRQQRVANLHYCKSPSFVERCIQVAQHLYGEPFVRRNEASFAILRMVYAEDVLHRQVDWCTLRHTAASTFNIPEGGVIPQVRKFTNGGLTKFSGALAIEDCDVEWSTTSSDEAGISNANPVIENTEVDTMDDCAVQEPIGNYTEQIITHESDIGNLPMVHEPIDDIFATLEVDEFGLGVGCNIGTRSAKQETYLKWVEDSWQKCEEEKNAAITKNLELQALVETQHRRILELEARLEKGE